MYTLKLRYAFWVKMINLNIKLIRLMVWATNKTSNLCDNFTHKHFDNAYNRLIGQLQYEILLEKAKKPL